MSTEFNISQKQIENRIFTIRDSQVMIDSDLADMYQVETKVLNQAVKRNMDRFPENFRFQLTIEEANELYNNTKVGDNLWSQFATSNSRSQFVTLNKTATKRGQNIKYIPYAFTEQGVAMLSSVLRSDIAVKVSIQIINAFVEMRKLIANHQGLLQRMEGIERKQLETDQKFEQVFKALESRNVIPTQGVFFDGQVFDAKEFNKSHDRFLIIDKSEIFHLGASLKDLGKKWFAFSQLNKNSVENILKSITI